MTLTEEVQLTTMSINNKVTALLNALQKPEVIQSIANQPNVRTSVQAVMASLRSDLKRMEDSRAYLLEKENQGDFDEAVLGMLDEAVASVKAVISAFEVIPEFRPQ